MKGIKEEKIQRDGKNLKKEMNDIERFYDGEKLW